MQLAIEICSRMAAGKSLTAVCRQPGMPCVTTVYAWRARHFDFDRLLSSARRDQADTLFWQAIDIADEKCADSVAVQRNRLRVDTRKYAAAKMNPRMYGDTLAIGGSVDLPPLRVDPIEGAKNIAFVLARAGHLMEQKTGDAGLPPAVAPLRQADLDAHHERLRSTFAYRMHAPEPGEAVDFDVEESAAEMGRIGDPRRVVSEPDTGRRPLSTRIDNQPT